MSNGFNLANRLREVFINGKWIANTNYREQILSVTWEEANYKMDHLNTIAALTFHINYYLHGLLGAFENGQLSISDKYSYNCPAISSEEDWKQLVNDFLSNAEKFAGKVETMSDEFLNGPFIDDKYGTCLRNIEGVIEHGYYHLGQMVIIKKMVVQSK